MARFLDVESQAPVVAASESKKQPRLTWVESFSEIFSSGSSQEVLSVVDERREAQDIVNRETRFSTGSALKITALDLRLVRSPFLVFVTLMVITARVLESFHIVSLTALTKYAGSTTLMNSAGFLVSFIVTFFLNQCVSRYFQFYTTSQAVIGRCFNLMLLSRAHLGSKLSWDMFRFSNVAHMTLYMGIMEKSNWGGRTSRWWQDVVFPRIDEHRLLSPGEIEYMNIPDHDGKCWTASGTRLMRVMCTLCETVVADAMKEDGLSAQLAATFHTELRDLRGLATDMNDLFDRPMPMSYLSVVMKVVCMYFLFTVMFAISLDSVFECGVMIIFSAYQLFGMIGIARSMESPFGLEMDDLSVVNYVDLVLCEAQVMMSTPSRSEFAGGTLISQPSLSSVESAPCKAVPQPDGPIEHSKSLPEVRVDLAPPGTVLLGRVGGGLRQNLR